MAKLTDRQKNNIVAKWKTGQYTKTQLAKSYKVDEKTIRKITDGIEQENADIVEAAVLIERVKKSEKSPIETAAINQAVKYRLEKEYTEDNNKIKVYDVTTKALDKIHSLLDGGMKPVKVNVGLGIQRIEEVPLEAKDLRDCIEAADKAAITLGVGDRHAPKGDVNIQNNQAVQVNDNKNMTDEEIEEEMIKRGLPLRLQTLT